MNDAVGRLVLVGTPIGHLGDLSPRAVETLRTADVIAAEDTRRTRALLSASGLSGAGRLVAFHAHNEAEMAVRLVARVRAGAVVACVSDAGMPGISDPGERLVAAALAEGVAVEVVPGPSAVLSALVLSGLPAGRFVFEGFLPRKGPERRSRLAALAAETRTTVLFEAPNRLAATIADLEAACGSERALAVARELTKLHETVWRGTLGSALGPDGSLSEDGPQARGEQVVVVGPAPERAAPSDAAVEAAVAEALTTGSTARDAATTAATRLGVSRRRTYAAATRLRSR